MPLGIVVRSRGLRGEMVLDRAVERNFPQGTSVLIGSRTFSLESLRMHQQRGLLQVAGIARLEEAEAMRGLEASVARSDVRLAQGEVLMQDLLGCDVVDVSNGTVYGMVQGWQDNGGQTLLEVGRDQEPPEEPMLIPYVPAICVEVLPGERVIRVRLPEGLAELNRTSVAE